MALITGQVVVVVFAAYGFVYCMQAAAQQTCMSKTDFAILCNSTLGGVVNGGRCFFAGNKTVSWNDSWTQCMAQGGSRLAQIHTSNEMSAITSYLQKKLPDTAIWVGHMHMNYNSQCWISDLTKSSWYTDPNTPTPNLISNNTWVRTRQNDDCYSRDGQCGTLYHQFTLFGDYQCSAPFYPLCELDNPVQDYKYVNNTCLTETPIMTYTSTTLMTCATEYCNGQFWCRSFNFHLDTNTCELFTWSVSDGPNKANMPNCAHYTYIP